MKKLIALFLALICMVGLVACGGNKDEDDEVLQNIIAGVKNAVAETGTAEISITTPDGTVTRDSIVVNLSTDDDNEEGNVIVIPYFNYMVFATNGRDIEIPDEMEGEISASIGKKQLIAFSDLEFNSDYFEGNTYTFDKNKFHAVITNASGFFGVNLTQGTVDFTMTMANNQPKRINIRYVTPLGYDVLIEAKYDY